MTEEEAYFTKTMAAAYEICKKCGGLIWGVYPDDKIKDCHCPENDQEGGIR